MVYPPWNLPTLSVPYPPSATRSTKASTTGPMPSSNSPTRGADDCGGRNVKRLLAFGYRRPRRVAQATLCGRRGGDPFTPLATTRRFFGRRDAPFKAFCNSQTSLEPSMVVSESEHRFL